MAIEIIKLRTSYLGHCGLVFGGVSKRSGQLRVPSNDLINTKQLSESCLMGKRGQEAKKLLFILESESEVAQLCPTLCNPMGRIAFQAPLWNSPDKNTGVGCHFLLQGIFLTQGSNPHLLCLLQWQVGSLPLLHLGHPFDCVVHDYLYCNYF